MALNGRVKRTIARGWMAWNRLYPRPPCLTILYYHAVRDEHIVNFRLQMSHLAKHAEVVWCDHKLPPVAKKPLVAITFDDAFASVARNALPILAQLGLPSTIFVPTGWMGKAPGWAMESVYDRDEMVLAPDALRQCLSPLVRLGAHCVSHPRLAHMDARGQMVELTESHDCLVRLVGAPVDLLAFPYGSFTDETVSLALKSGYRHAFTVIPQAIDPRSADPLRGRTAAEPFDEIAEFDRKMRGAYRWMPDAISIKRYLSPVGSA